MQDARIHMSESDFVNITRNGELCNAEGEIGIREFEAIMRKEMMSYLQTRLTDFSNFRTGEDIEFTHLGALKTILSEVLMLAEEQRTASKGMRDMLGQKTAGWTCDADQHSSRAIPDLAEATKALQRGMDTLTAELAGVKAVIQEHIAGLGKADFAQPPPALLPMHSDLHTTSLEPPSSSREQLPRQHLHGGKISSCNGEARLGAASSSAVVTATASDFGLATSLPTSSDACERYVQPAAGRRAGRQSPKEPCPLPISPSGIAPGDGSATALIPRQNGAQGKPKVPGGKRRSVDATNPRTPRLSRAVQLHGRSASALLAGPDTFEMLVAAAEVSSPQGSAHPAPGERGGIAVQPRHKGLKGQPATSVGGGGLTGSLACHAQLAASARRQLESETVLVPSNRRLRQELPRDALLSDPLGSWKQ